MTGPLEQHTRRLNLVCAACIGGIAVYAAVVYLAPPPLSSPFAQANHLLWALAALTALNLVTLTPVRRAMLAGPLRVYAVSQDLDSLLRAHLAAHVTIFARLEAIAIFGLVLYFLTGRGDWFWAFTGIAAAGMVLLWPTRGRVISALGIA